MATESTTALFQIVTAANMAGVTEAKAGFLGLNASTLALMAGLGILVAVGKAAIENTESQAKAHLSLQQAVSANNDTMHDAIVTHADTSKQVAALEVAQRHLAEVEAGMPTKHKATALELMHLADAHAAVTKAQAALKTQMDITSTSAAIQYINIDGLQKEFDAWAEANKRYIPDQYAAETALAAFVRSGANATDAMRELNIALDLSTLKGTDMASAQLMVTLAVAGNAKGLKQLGITTQEYNDIMKNKTLTTEQQHLALLALIEGKTKDGRKAQTDLTQSTQALNKDWQDMTTKIGPPLLSLFTAVAGAADTLVTKLDNLGKDPGWNKGVSNFLGVMQNSIIQDVQWVENAIKSVQGFASWLTGAGAPPSGQTHVRGRAAGGPVSAGQSYLVGERGPEMFTPGSSGSISPNGAGGTTVHVHMEGIYAGDGPSLDRLANLVAQRLSYATGR